jgi:hypothetical protein
MLSSGCGGELTAAVHADRTQEAAQQKQYPQRPVLHRMDRVPVMKAFLPIMLLALAFSQGLAAQQSDAVPRKLSARIGGMLSVTFQVELTDGALVYTSSRARETTELVKIKPTPDQWREFRAALDDINVWRWEPSYINRKILDGTQWSLEIEYADRSLKTGGSNSYPDDKGKPNGQPQSTPAFARYRATVEKLLGGKMFR